MMIAERHCRRLSGLQKGADTPWPARRIVIDGSQTNQEAICATTNRLQDQRRIKRRSRPMLGFKSQASAVIILSGIEMKRKRHAGYAFNPNPSLAERFAILAA